MKQQRLRIRATPKNRAAAMKATAQSGAKGPEYTYVNTCTKEQHDAYGCLEYSIEHGLLDQHIYTMGIAPLAPTGYGLLIMSPRKLSEVELSSWYPGLTDWLEKHRDDMKGDYEPKPGDLPIEMTI